MTIKNAKNLIIQYFHENSNKDSISFDELNSFIKTTDDKNECLTSILGALVMLVNENILYLNPLSDVSNPKTLIWVLISKLDEIEKTLKISGELAAQINSIVSDFSEATDTPQIMPNGLEITQQEIMVILDMLNMYASQEDSEPEVEEEKPKSNKK